MPLLAACWNASIFVVVCFAYLSHFDLAPGTFFLCETATVDKQIILPLFLVLTETFSLQHLVMPCLCFSAKSPKGAIEGSFSIESRAGTGSLVRVGEWIVVLLIHCTCCLEFRNFNFYVPNLFDFFFSFLFSSPNSREIPLDFWSRYDWKTSSSSS